MSSRARPVSPRRRMRPWLLFVALAPALTACMQMEALIRVGADGSGTIERTLVVTNDFLMAFLAETDDMDLCGEAGELEATAARLGDGVRLQSTERLEGEGEPGCHTVFAFDDINQLRFDLEPESLLPGTLAETFGEMEALGDEPIDEAATDESEAPAEGTLLFHFEPGDPATLVLQLNQGWGEGDSAEEASLEDEPESTSEESGGEFERAAMRVMLQDARFAIVLEVEGSLAETDATFVEGNRITILEMDFNELLESEADLASLFESDPQSADEARELMTRVSGVRFEPKEEVTIRFRGSDPF